MQRRAFLATAISVGLTGCSGSASDDDLEETASPADGSQESTPMETPTDTEKPTATASETETPTETPTATPVPEPDPIEFDGTGQKVTDRFEIQGGFTAFEMDHQGDSNFQVELIDTSSGETEELLANVIGTWNGHRATYVPPGEFLLDINADGSWSIEVTQPRPTQADVMDVPVELTGDTVDYDGPIYFPGLVQVTAKHAGDSNFAVWVRNIHGEHVDLLFNEIGRFEGETTFSGEGHGWITVEANGDWSIRIEEA